GDPHRTRADTERQSLRTGGDMERMGDMSGTDQHKHDEWPNLEADPNSGAGTKAPDGDDTHKAASREDLTKQFQELGQRLAATGLRELNEQLRRLAERLERRDDTTAATDTTTTASTASADPTPASIAATAPEIDQLLGGPDVATAPSVEPTNDLPSKPEGPAG